MVLGSLRETSELSKIQIDDCKTFLVSAWGGGGWAGPIIKCWQEQTVEFPSGHFDEGERRKGMSSSATALINYANVLLSPSQLRVSTLESCDYVPYTKPGKNWPPFEIVPMLTPLRAKAKY